MEGMGELIGAACFVAVAWLLVIIWIIAIMDAASRADDSMETQLRKMEKIDNLRQKSFGYSSEAEKCATFRRE